MPDSRSPQQETRLAKWRRRTISISVITLMWLLLLGTLPLWALITWVVDRLSKGPSAWFASFAFLTGYLTNELVGVLASLSFECLALFDRGPGARMRAFERYFRLQQWWSGGLLRWAGRTYGLRLQVVEHADLSRPMILLLRHASIADTLIAGEFVSRPHGIHLRHILKRELRVDPCLDIVGDQLPNYFVDRESDDPVREREKVARLMDDLGREEGVLIYPEGTRFTEAKRASVIRALEARGDVDRAKQARALEHVLPPRLGGPIALLQANPGLDVVFCAHVGFEGAGSLRGLVAGVLLDRTVDVGFWRVPFEEIPREASAQGKWLYAHWQRIDRWVGERKEQAAILDLFD